MSYLTFAILTTVGSVLIIGVFGERFSEKWSRQAALVGGILMGYGWLWAFGPADRTFVARALFLLAGIGLAYSLMRFVRKAK
ncbi:MAG: hypothetical protein ACC619_03780 [Paracoccaceae bacterium]